jgi:hypothetical protein
MNFNQLIKIYFQLIDSIYPNYKPIKLSNYDVFNRLYSNRKPPYYNCCTLHSSLKNLQKKIKRSLKTDYEKSIYQKANKFFYQLNSILLFKLKNSIKYKLFFSKDIKINLMLQNEFNNLITNNQDKWELLSRFLVINRKGKILDFIMPNVIIKKIKNIYLFNNTL